MIAPSLCVTLRALCEGPWRQRRAPGRLASPATVSGNGGTPVSLEFWRESQMRRMNSVVAVLAFAALGTLVAFAQAPQAPAGGQGRQGAAGGGRGGGPAGPA